LLHYFYYTTNWNFRYLCAYAYFISLTHNRDRTLFVHVPDFDDKVTEEVMFSALRLIINECISEIAKKNE
uniref:Peptidase C15 n=1 Tax=Enterobius vermicularis TaxID=51028 RepID=A0A0N4UXH7_ENTVE